ncbi:hypothetical protein ACFOKF_18865 [Sphingobium rhizovicinum]|uniref:Uncharacterized protein n=1 Tax=Sphingobium rhizovicinum TaxID=432308 RepID=A0ABV7NLH3_9SPHN
MPISFGAKREHLPPAAQGDGTDADFGEALQHVDAALVDRAG